ncbi:MAG: 2-hydroxyacyl-CoA dehydratase [Deltaproteobacteria bacterium]|nr:2-hydroxyacyl-CoA dehydratase [Deltaproteobacteria bacterium]
MNNVFQEIIENRHKIARKWKERNQKRVVGYFCCITPEEMIYASGLLPVRIAGSSEKLEVVPDHVPQYGCGFVRSCLDLAARGIYDYLDGVIIPNTCDLIPKLEYWWRELCPRTTPLNEGQESHPYVYYLNYPEKVTGPKVNSFYLMQLRTFKQYLERMSEQLITDEMLQEAIGVYNEHYALMEQLDELRKQDPPLISGYEAWQVEFAGLLMPKNEHNALLREYLKELPLRPDKPEKKVRLYLSASALDRETAELYKIIGECGGEVVSEDISAGSSHYSGITLNPTIPPLEAMVERSLATPCPRSTVTATLKAPYPMFRWNYLKRTMEGYQVKGAVFYNLNCCECRSLENPFLKEKIKEVFHIPVLFLEGDYTPEGLNQMRGRIETFIEMIGA